MKATTKTETFYTLEFEEADLHILAAYLINSHPDQSSKIANPTRLKNIREFIIELAYPAKEAKD